MDRVLMDYFFNTELANNYKSNSQKIRVMSESWVITMYFPLFAEALTFQN